MSYLHTDMGYSGFSDEMCNASRIMGVDKFFLPLISSLQDQYVPYWHYLLFGLRLFIKHSCAQCDILAFFSNQYYRHATDSDQAYCFHTCQARNGHELRR